MYTKGEVVWAKIKGFPWWPGVVAKVIEEKGTSHSSIELLVNFIGENSHAQLSLEKVAKFQDKYNEFAKMKKKKLLESIEIANKIIRGETTFEDENERLKIEYKNSLVEQKPKPKPINPSNGVKGKNGKSDDKSQSNENDSGLGQYESDQSSVHEAEIMSPSDKAKKKVKTAEKKESKRKLSDTKGQNGSALEKSPILNKNIKTLNVKRELEVETEDIEEVKPVKALKIDQFIDEASKSEPKRFEDLSGKLIRQTSKHSSVASNNSNTNSSNVTTDSSTNVPNGILINTNISPQNNNGGLIRNRSKEFDALHELIIEKITNYGSPSVSGPILEKSIENVISKINPEAVSISEILENDLGKNIHTLLVLLDELSSSVPKSGTNIETVLSGIKDRLINYIDIIKNRLVFHYIENVEYCSYWLKRLEEKRSEETDPQKKNKEAKPSKSESMEEEIVNGSSKIDEEIKEKQPGVLQINFEDYRFENEKKKVLVDKNTMVTTSTTKIGKPIYNLGLEVAKLGEKKEIVVNPMLRKKICLKMCKILQEKYLLEKDTAQKLTMRIETAIRQASPDMQSDYKDKVLHILKALKYSLIDLKEFGTDFHIDFNMLKERLDMYQKQHADSNLDGGFDSPQLTKEMSRDSSMLNGKMGEVK